MSDPFAPPSIYTENGGRGALLSECGRYRYRLWRLWDDLAPVMVWVMLNPSTADADVDDPTIRKCIGFAKRQRHGGIIVVNLFAWRATKPTDLTRVPEPVGPDNDQHIVWALRAPLLASSVAGWGRPPNRRIARRADHVRHLMRIHRQFMSFGRTKEGHPRHPLYLPYTTPLEKA